MTEQAWIEQIAKKDLLHGQSIRRHVEKMRMDLGGPSPTPLEQVVVDRIVVCWLATQYAVLAEAASKGDGNKVAELKIRRAESMNRRLLAAAKSLGTIRRLLGGLKIEITHMSPKSAGAAAAGTQNAGEILSGVPVGTPHVEDADPSCGALSDRIRNFFDRSEADRREPAELVTS